MNKTIIFGLLTFVFLLGVVSANVSCDKNSVESTAQSGQVPPSRTFTCSNDNPNQTENIQILASPSFFSISPDLILTNSSSPKTFTINFNSITQTREGFITFGGNTIQVRANLNTTVIDPNACQLSPSLVSYTQIVQQSTTFELPKIIFNPKNCNGELSITSAFLSGGITTSEGQKPVFVKSASSKDILLGVDTSGLSSAPYISRLTVVAFGQTFTDVSTINIVVTGGTNPNTDFDINTLPACSLTANELNLNNTYSMVCTGIKPGVSIYPVVESEYIKGVGPGDDSTPTNFVWDFQPKKYGNTFIKAEFRYLNLPVGDPFIQEIKISSSGQVAAGTDLEFKFFPDLNSYSSDEPIVIQLIDNKTKSLVPNSKIWVNSRELNSTTQSFEYLFESDEEYELRGQASGYNDIVRTITISPKPITITIFPNAGSSSTLFNITTDPQNASLFIDEFKVENPYYATLTSGEHTIKAVFKSYQTNEINFSVSSFVVVEGGCSLENFKKNIAQVCVLSDIANYTVLYKKDPTDTQAEVMTEGTGENIEFTPNKNGWYYINADGRQVFATEIKGSGFWKAKWWFMYWWLWFITPLVLLLFILIIRRIRDSEGDEITSSTQYS